MAFELCVDDDGIPFSDYGNYRGHIDIGREVSVLSVAERALWYWDTFALGGAEQPTLLSYNWGKWPVDRQKNPKTAATAVRQFNNCIEWILRNIVDDGDISVWEYPYPISYNTAAGWRSAHAQAVCLQALARADKLDAGNGSYLRKLPPLLAAFRRPVERGGLCEVLDNGDVWFEKVAAPGNDRPKILNGMMFAVLGLHDVGLRLGDREALQLADQGAGTICRAVGRYDLGNWSAYDAVGKPCSQHYHAIHCAQLERLGDIFPYPELGEYAARFSDQNLSRRIETLEPLKKTRKEVLRVIRLKREAGQLASAERDILAVHPDPMENYLFGFEFCELAMDRCDWSGAVALWRQLCGTYKKVPAVLRYSGALRANGNFSAARNVIRRQLKKTPDDAGLKKELRRINNGKTGTGTTPPDRFVSSVAKNYEAVRSRKPHWQREDNIIASLVRSLPGGTSVLDLPSGTGRFFPHYAMARHRVTAVDISPDMLDLSREKASVLSMRIDVAQGDVQDLPFPDNSFDVTVCLRLMTNLDFGVSKKALLELRRVTKNSLIVDLKFAVPGTGPFSYPRDDENAEGRLQYGELEALISESGFGIRESHFSYRTNPFEVRIFHLSKAGAS